MNPYQLWSRSFTIRPANEYVGADLEGIELSTAPDNQQVMLEIREALNAHLVLRIRGQRLTPAQAVRFTEWFGPVIDTRRPTTPRAVHVPGFPQIQVLSNAIDPDGQRLGDGNTAAQIWHSDAGQWEVPPGMSFFYGRTIPNPAPRTSFLNMIRVYAALPDVLKQRIAPLRPRHHMYSHAVDVAVHRHGKSLPHAQRAAGRPHPVVRRHIGTNQPILYLPMRRDSVIDGMEEGESTALLAELWAFADSLPFKWSFAIDVDDVVLWDNAALAHCREGWAESHDRTMWHLLAEGERPTPTYQEKTVNAHNIHQLGY
jgi:taurine dioxygenase